MHEQRYKGCRLLSYEDQMELINEPDEDFLQILYEQEEEEDDMIDVNCPVTTACVQYPFVHYQSSIPAQIKGPSSMYQNIEVKEVKSEDQTKHYLCSEFYTIFCRKDAELRLKYGMDAEMPPTVGELIAAFKKGEYELKDEDLGEDREISHYSEIGRLFKFPKCKKDRKGYDKAYNKLNTEYNSKLRHIKVASPAEGLKILEAFESATLH